jgi:hypothetical protein
VYITQAAAVVEAIQALDLVMHPVDWGEEALEAAQVLELLDL